MQIRLDPDWKRRAFQAALVGVVTIYLALAAREAAAEWLLSRGSLGSLQTAARLVPENAEYRYRLGRYNELVLRDETAAISHFQRAIELNPHNAHYWLDLANAYEVAGNESEQVNAVDRAVVAAPTDPEVAWYAANLYLALGQNERALHELHVVMGSSPEAAGAALVLCWRLTQDVHTLLQNATPTSTDGYFWLISFLTSKSRSEDSLVVWDALVASGQPISTEKTFDYIRYLVLHRMPADASHVWWQMASRNGYAAYLPNSTNALVNGNFDLTVLNGGFDWQYHRQSGVTLTLDPAELHDGHRTLSIAFDGPGVVDAGISQLILVRPNTTYEFSAYYKNEDFDGAGGPHFALQDFYEGTTFFESEVLKQAPDWKQVSSTFTTGPQTNLIALRVRRLPESSPIRGKLWISDFRLSVVPSSEGISKDSGTAEGKS